MKRDQAASARIIKSLQFPAVAPTVPAASTAQPDKVGSTFTATSSGTSAQSQAGLEGPATKDPNDVNDTIMDSSSLTSNASKDEILRHNAGASAATQSARREVQFLGSDICVTHRHLSTK